MCESYRGLLLRPAGVGVARPKPPTLLGGEERSPHAFSHPQRGALFCHARPPSTAAARQLLANALPFPLFIPSLYQKVSNGKGWFRLHGQPSRGDKGDERA